jgi:hypothetical protein
VGCGTVEHPQSVSQTTEIISQLGQLSMSSSIQTDLDLDRDSMAVKRKRKLFIWLLDISFSSSKVVWTKSRTWDNK